MALHLFNTLTRRKEEFVPLHGNGVGMYTCGPTVYNFAHIGNLRSYIFADTAKRALRYTGYEVKHVMNITDVGHLTSDADAGDDKMLVAAAREKKSVWDIAAFYTDAFFRHTSDLNIIRPDIVCRATDHIPQQIAMIEKLFRQGVAYEQGGNVYFDTSKFPSYGALAGLDKGAQRKARVEKDPNKKNPHDFVLWFTKSKFGEQDMRWESPWGVGYPGWHIECSAMSTKYLGQPFDIHSGGVDHIPVHHTNEIAQSEAAEGKPFVRFWLHGEFLIVDEKRMGKSEGNLLTLDTLKEHGFDPLSFRFFCLQTHYRQQLNFSFNALSAAQAGLSGLLENIVRIQHKGEGVPLHEEVSTAARETAQRFQETLMERISDDLDAPAALAGLFSFVRDIQSADFLLSDYAYFIDCIRDADRVFGLHLVPHHLDTIPFEISELLELRTAARREKNWERADALRAQIEAHGYSVEDVDEGTRVMKKIT